MNGGMRRFATIASVTAGFRWPPEIGGERRTKIAYPAGAVEGEGRPAHEGEPEDAEPFGEQTPGRAGDLGGTVRDPRPVNLARAPSHTGSQHCHALSPPFVPGSSTFISGYGNR